MATPDLGSHDSLPFQHGPLCWQDNINLTTVPGTSCLHRACQREKSEIAMRPPKIRLVGPCDISEDIASRIIATI
jgi:hypothetical protein